MRSQKPDTWVPVSLTQSRLHLQPRTLALITACDRRKQLEAKSRLQEAERKLKKNEEYYRELVENANDIIFTFDLAGYITSINRAGELFSGYNRDELQKMNLAQFLAPGQGKLVQQLLTCDPAGTRTAIHELEAISKAGRQVSLEVQSRFIFEGDHPVGVQGIARDITERKSLEKQLVQAQKMEAIGQLAGGVAHDFNNVLTVILGSCDITLQNLPPQDPLRQPFEQIRKAGTRAATLTRQLLAFSRKQVLVPVVLDLGNMLQDLESMLRRLIGEDIEFRVNCSAPLWMVTADPGQLEQVIMNLVVNARDAMPLGGKLTIETRNAELDSSYATSHERARPGEYVLLAVSDTGHGMTEEVRSHMFEPFFTTKGPEKGSGLGLATVYGIVKQSGGHIEVYSNPGIGTTFKIFLPREGTGLTKSKSHHGLSRSVFPGTETILLVEDDDAVRSLAQNILTTSGYHVLPARHGEEALQQSKQHPASIHILVTDVVMPIMSGRLLAEHMRKLRPDLKVLFMSGYTDDAIVHHGILEQGVDFLHKPFNPLDLTRKVREVLDASV